MTIPLLEVMGVKYDILDRAESVAEKQIDNAVKYMRDRQECFALIIEKDTFSPYSLRQQAVSNLAISREDAIKTVTSYLDDKDAVVSTTGMISRELFEYRTFMRQEHEKDFLTVGSMGHASQIALGVALAKPERRIWCFDGDGAIIMHMGSMAIIGDKSPRNLVHVVFNNGAHDSVGGQPTVGLKIDLPAIARAVGYRHVYSESEMSGLEKTLNIIKNTEGPVFLQVCVKKGNRPDLGRPTTTPIHNKKAFMSFLED